MSTALRDLFRAHVTELREALDDTEMRVSDDISGSVERRSVVVGPPAFAWEGMCDPDAPTSMTLSVYLIENVHERAIERLLANLPALIEALQGLSRETLVTGCVPGAFPTGGSDLPCYQITAETTL